MIKSTFINIIMRMHSAVKEVPMSKKEKASADTTLTCFRGYADCVEGAAEKGVLVAGGVYEPGAVRNTSAMAQAYEMGRNV